MTPCFLGGRENVFGGNYKNCSSPSLVVERMEELIVKTPLEEIGWCLNER